MKDAFLAIALVALFVALPAVAQPPTDTRAEIVSRGRQLFSDRGCVRCHTVGAAGTPIALDVTSMARKYSASELVQWLRDPRAVEPRAHMPKIELSDAEREAIAAFVTAQK